MLRDPERHPISHNTLGRQAAVKCTCEPPGSFKHRTIDPL